MGTTLSQDYLLSLPERAVRSAAAVIGGTSLLITETLLPDVVRDSTTYRFVIGNLQNFMIDRVAQVPYFAASEEERVIDGYISRKLAGNVLEVVGLMTMRFSPVWVFALAGDAAAGSKVFLDRLVMHLKQNGVIDPASDPDDIAGLLAAIQRASSTSATAVDTPPLSRAQLAGLADDLADGYGQMFSRSQSLLARFEALQSRMERTAGAEDLSVEAVSGIMAIDVATLSKASVGTTRAVSRTSAELFGEKILVSYERTLDELNRQGAGVYLNRYMKPFIDAAVDHFNPNRPTWTQSFLVGKPAMSQPTGDAPETNEGIIDQEMAGDDRSSNAHAAG